VGARVSTDAAEPIASAGGTGTGRIVEDAPRDCWDADGHRDIAGDGGDGAGGGLVAAATGRTMGTRVGTLTEIQPRTPREGDSALR